jgi:nucleoside-diphosphate-sugar epimerase
MKKIKKKNLLNLILSKKSKLKIIKKKKILLIGGTGLLGSACRNEFKKKKHYTMTMSRGIKNNLRVNIRTKNYYNMPKEEIREIIKKNKIDTVINFIIFKKKQAVRDIKIYKGYIKNYFFISSTSLYKENFTDKKITEKNKIFDKRWSYAVYKYQCEKEFLKAFKKNFPVTIIRSGHVYSKKTIPTPYIGAGYEFIKHLQNGGKAIIPFNKKNKWSLIHAKDFASNFSEIVNSNKIYGKIINIASEQAITWEKIIKIYLQNLNINPNFKEINSINLPKKFKNAIDGDRAKNCLYDNYYFKKKIGFFREKIHIQNGLKSSIRYFIKNYKNFKLNNKTLKLFNKFNHY